MATKKKQEIEKKEAAPVALWQEEQETGFENMTADDFAIPFLTILQKGSPQVDDQAGEYIEGARPGMIYNTATGELYDQVKVIPCHYVHCMVEWVPRESGSGFRGQHPVGSEEGMKRDESGRYVTPDGNYLVDTRYFFVLLMDNDGDAYPAVIGMSSTQLKKSRNWVERMKKIKVDGVHAPMWSHCWNLTTTVEENAKGSWRGWKIGDAEPVTDRGLYELSKKWRETFKSAETRMKPPEQADEEAPI